MTDEQIIKALECCTNCSSPEVCKECPYLKCTTKKGCFEEVLTDALALINRQKAEIERLENSLAISKKETQRYVENYKRQKKEMEEYRNIIERATEGIREVKAMLPRELAKERSKAVKEFVERLKKEALFDSGWCVLQPDVIDNLVKEFTEEKT